MNAVLAAALVASAVLTPRDPLSNARFRFETAKKGVVAFIGGSITEMPGWRVKVIDDLRRRFPETDFTFISAGISSTCSDAGAYRLEEDVLKKGVPDLFFVEYAVNDSGDGYYLPGRHDPATYETHALRGVEGIVRHLRKAAPEADMIMTFFTTGDQLAEVRAGKTPSTYAIDSRVAGHYGITTVDIARSIVEGEQAGDFSWEAYGADCHPHEPGCVRIAAEYAKLFDREWSGPPPEASVAHALPAEPLDAACYDEGRFLPLSAVTCGAGWSVGPVDWAAIPGENRENYRAGDLLVSSDGQAECAFSFTGSAVGLWLLAGPDAGSFAFSIDGGEFVPCPLANPYMAYLHYPFVETLADALPAGRHRIVLKNLSGTTRIFRICINGKE